MGTLSEQPPSGIVRNLTEVFILLRNNAIQSRQIFASQNAGASYSRGEDKMSLIPLHSDGDIEVGGGVDKSNIVAARTPPDWVSILDEVQYEISRIRTRLRELKDLQTAHLGKPAFSDDSSGAEEKRIEVATEEVGRLLEHCRRLVQHIDKHEANLTRKADRILIRNAVASLYGTLQLVTLDFRTQQNNYLKQVKSASADGMQHYFEAFAADDGGVNIGGKFGDFFGETSTSHKNAGQDFGAFDDFAPSSENGQNGGQMTLAQLQMIEQNSENVKEREKEIITISKSIVEVNQLFKDIAEMIVDQGSILDRIDYNIEQTDLRVKSALQEVQQAERYQRKNKKLMCLMILAVLIILFVFLLLFT